MKGLCSGRFFFLLFVCLFFTNIGGRILNARGVKEHACYSPHRPCNRPASRGAECPKEYDLSSAV